MDTVLTEKHTNMETHTETGGQTISRKEIRRQKLMEYLASKRNLPSNRTNVGKEEKVNMEKPALKVSMDKENRIPLSKSSNQDTKVKTLTLQSSHVLKRPFGQNHKADKTLSNATRTQSHKNTSMINKESKPNAFTRTYTISTSKSSVNAPVKPKMPPTKQSNGTHAAKSVVASANMKNNINGRLVHGPIIKTRTGLVPAIPQPKNTKSGIPKQATNAAIVKKAPSGSALAKNESRPSKFSLRQNTSSVTLQPVREKTVGMAKLNKPNGKLIKPALTKCTKPYVSKQQSSVLPLQSGLTLKSNIKVGTAKGNVLAGQCKNMADTKKTKPGQTKINANSLPQRDSLNVCTANNIREKSKITANNKSSETKKVSVEKPNESRLDRRRIRAVPQTAPQPSRTFSLTNKNNNNTWMKTPQLRDPPQTENKALTAAQEERIRKLQEWRESKGICYKRPSLLPRARARRTVAVPQPFWSAMTQEDDVHSLITAVDRSLADCIKLLGEGCPTVQVKEVLSRLPAVSQKFSKYWICQARVMEREGDLDVLSVFEKAVGVVLEPIDELRAVVFEILKRRDEKQENKEEEAASSPVQPAEPVIAPTVTPKPLRALICGEKGDSSVIKYKITATPGGPPTQQPEPTVVNGQEVMFFTPVRRSVRIERANVRYPLSLQDHDLCVTSYNDLMAEEERENPTSNPMYIYRENQALQEKVQVQYI